MEEPDSKNYCAPCAWIVHSICLQIVCIFFTFLVLSVDMYGNETPLGMMLLIILKRPKSLTLSLRLDNVDHINTCRTSSWDFLSVLNQQPIKNYANNLPALLFKKKTTGKG